MRLYIIFVSIVTASAFVVETDRLVKTKLELASRREAIGAMATLVLTPKVAGAFSQQLDENIVEQSQQSTGGKLDLNAAFVVSSVFRKIKSIHWNSD